MDVVFIFFSKKFIADIWQFYVPALSLLVLFPCYFLFIQLPISNVSLFFKETTILLFIFILCWWVFHLWSCFSRLFWWFLPLSGYLSFLGPRTNANICLYPLSSLITFIRKCLFIWYFNQSCNSCFSSRWLVISGKSPIIYFSTPLVSFCCDFHTCWFGFQGWILFLSSLFLKG